MKHIAKYLPLILSLLIISCNGSNKERNNTNKQIDDYTTKIDSLIQTNNPRKFNGVISISQNGVTKYSRAYGYSNFENKTPISANDNFRIQSNSKQITAVLILKEVENGKIDLKNTIRKYLPDLKQTWADTVTVHQLLNMSSGIESLDKPLLFKSGTDFHYSNPAYGLLGRIIKNSTGEEYTKVANKLLKELGMNNSYCYEMNKTHKGLINGYSWTDNTFKLVEFKDLGFTEEGWSDFIPTGGIISNLTDLNIWDTKLHTGEILKRKSYDAMTTSEIPDLFEALSDEKIVYGYGVDISDKPIRYIGHGGTGFGFVSIKFYIPEKDLNVIVLENIYNQDIEVNYHFEKEIRKIMLNSNLME